MLPAKPRPAARLGIATVSFFPDLSMLSRQLGALPDDALKLIVDNSGAGAARDALKALLLGWPEVRLIENAENRGIAAAFNQAASQLAALGCSEVLLLDQDSEPHPGAVSLLWAQWVALNRQDARVAAVGPCLFEPDSSVQHGFHRMRFGLWTRHFPTEGASTPVPLANLNGSGTLMSLSVYLALGGLDESLFIDHVDTEWSFRLKASGYQLLGLPAVRFDHRMGQATMRVWLLGWRAWPARSPLRHYYVCRNTLSLLLRRYVPLTWKFWALVRMVLNYAVYLGPGEGRASQRNEMRRGVADGWRGRMGLRPS